MKSRNAVRAMLALAAFAITFVITGAATSAPTGATATKDCPGTSVDLGQTISCNFTVSNDGTGPATITALTETNPFPGGTVTSISCTAGGVTYQQGSTLPNGVVCSGTFNVTVPNDPTLCGGVIEDRVEIDLLYPQFTPALTAGAFATNTESVVCPPHIKVTKTATALDKVGDPVTYTVTITNTGETTVNRVSVMDTLVGDITTDFPATIAAGASATFSYTRTVLATDPNPLVNTVTAVYSDEGLSDTETASATTNLFHPSVAVTKSCAPSPVQLGQVLLCTITITNTSTSNAPALNEASIMDTRSGDLFAVGNPDVKSSTCTATLAVGASCTIVTQNTIVAADLPGPLVNTVSVLYHPTGFPNDIRGSATATVPINFAPDYTLTKSCGPSPENVGGTTTYTFVVTNTGNVSLDLTSAVDTLLGTLTSQFPTSLAPGQSVTITTTRTVLATDPSPLPNTVTTVYQADGTATALTRTASCSINIVHPSMTLTKTCGPSPENVGDTTTYTFTIANTGDVALTRQSVDDTLLGTLTSQFPATLAPGQSVTVTATRVVLSTDPTPLPNTVTSVYQEAGFTVTLTKTASCSINIVHPNMTLTKTCAPATENIGDTTTYTFTITNTGDVGLTRQSVMDSLLGDITSTFPAVLAPGQSVVVTATRVVLATDPSTLTNTVTSVYKENGFTVTLTRTASCSITVLPPPGTVKVTIGFWKTHAPASCKQGNGNQADALTPALGSGFSLGADYKLTSACVAVQLLSKNNINGVDQPGDPIFNMLAQMVGAELNIGAGGTVSGSCSFIKGAITDANTLLTAIHFNGVTYDMPLTAAQQSEASTLEGLFGSYNNDSTTC